MANTEFAIDTSSLKRLTADLSKTTPEIRKAVTVTLREGAGLIAAEAKTLSSWSTRIPGSIRVAGSGTKIVVRAGGRKAPHAAPFENKGVPGSFRHPVFGNRQAWVSQGARPFLAPAAALQQDAMLGQIVRGLDAVFRSAGFR